MRKRICKPVSPRWWTWDRMVEGTGPGGCATPSTAAQASGRVGGPRMQVAGPVLSITPPGNTSFPLNFKPAEANLVADGSDALRAAVRELAHYGVNWVKLMVTGSFIFKPTGEMVNQALP